MELVKKAVKAGDELVKLGEKHLPDGFTADDLMAIPQLFPHIVALYEVFKERDAFLEQLKDFGEETLEELKS